jgi:tetraacyldisaccharide 4'-kinase
LAAPVLEKFFLRTWQQRGVFACLFWPLSLLYQGLTGMRRWGYARAYLRRTRLPVPVVVVGNIFVGGTGKTPFTIWLVQALQEAGWRPGVISRGHGGQTDTPLVVSPSSSPMLVGDEPLLIAQRCACPVLVGRHRVAVGQALLAAYPDVNIVISDDGLQHYALEREVEILLFDQRGVGNGWLLPAGPLRESVARRADFVVLNNTASVPRLVLSTPSFTMQLQGRVAVNLAEPTRTRMLTSFQGRGLAAAGIGHPARFFTMLHEMGLEFEAMPLPDHYAFAENPFTQVEFGWILITEKDAVKCRQIPGLQNDPRVWVVPVSAQLDAALLQQIVEKCGGCPIA